MSQCFLLSKDTLNNNKALINNFNSLPTLNMPVNHLPDTDNIKNQDTLNFFIKSDLSNAIKKISERERTKIETIYLATFNVLLSRYTGQDDIFMMQAFIKADIDQPVQLFFNGLRTRFSSNTPFDVLLKSISDTGLSADPLERLTFDDIKRFFDHIEAGQQAFQTLFIYNQPQSKASAEVINQTVRGFANLEIGLLINENNDGNEGQIFYNQGKFDKDFITAFTNHYIILLNEIAKIPDKAVGAYQIVSDREFKKIIIEFNNTLSLYPKHKTLAQLFEEQVQLTPNNIALCKGEKRITYEELNHAANQLAHFLMSKDVKPGDNIGLLATRDFQMIIGMLGILKAGAAYVPIDPDYPVDRQEYIYSQSSLKLVIADKGYPLKSILSENEFLTINFDALKQLADGNPGVKVSSNQLAYTIYTSGSTGRPKGVMIKHHSAVNLVLAINKRFSITANDNLLFITSMCFDLSVYDIFGLLATGGRITIAEQTEIQNVKMLQQMLIAHNITFWDSVPTTMDYLIKDLENSDPKYLYKGLKTVFMSGDWIPVDLPDRIKKFMPEARVISLGGATEATVWSNFFPIIKTDKKWLSIPYGKPLDNNFFYILNDQLQPVPFGVLGDLYIGGVGVSPGYANEPDKTAAAFIPDPFNEQLGGMMYRTGDLGKIWPDLNMEFVGRKDNQVKIQGFRIELGEIESVLNTFNTVSTGVVLANTDADGKKRLVGYVVPNGNFDKDELTSYLKTKLPYYMIPSVWLTLPQLTLTSNGKVDRKALPDVNENAGGKFIQQASSTTEKMVKTIWLEYMELKDLSITDNFFDLGGHSLMAVQILTELEKQTGVTLPLAVLFKYPDVRSLAKFIDGNIKVKEQYKCLVPIKPKGSKPALYVIHGEGLNVLNFSRMAALLDPEQPVFGLQARGLDGVDEPLDDISAIAADYLQEILRHNVNGPYIIAGYSFGGYVAVEMQRQMECMDKKIDMLIMLDTDAERPEPKSWYKLGYRKLKRNIIAKTNNVRAALLNLPNDNVYKPVDNIYNKQIHGYWGKIKAIQQKHQIAFNKFRMQPFNNKVYLFRANVSVHYADDMALFSWAKFAQKGVEVFHVPGDHRSMFEPPYVSTLADTLQTLLDKRSNPF